MATECPTAVRDRAFDRVRRCSPRVPRTRLIWRIRLPSSDVTRVTETLALARAGPALAEDARAFVMSATATTGRRIEARRGIPHRIGLRRRACTSLERGAAFRGLPA